MKDEYLESLLSLIKSKKNDDPKISYTALLHQKGLSEILNKISEEAEETIIAAQSEGNDDLVHEIADLWFHTMVMLSHLDLTPQQVLDELKERFKISGLAEKASRQN